MLTNSLVEDPKNIKNTICLIAKQYIYRQRCQKKAISLLEIKSIVWKTQDIEKYIAIKNENIDKYNKKWNNKLI